MLSRTLRPLAASLATRIVPFAPSAALPLSLRLRTLTTANESTIQETAVQEPAAQESQATKPPVGLPYFVARNSLMNFSVYDKKVAGGNKNKTIIKRVEGDIKAFKEDLVEALGLERREIRINSINNHITIEGGRQRMRVVQFLETNGF
ncbi:mitochondrial large subunit ribosomal protein-domain-containing protein [Xylariaceae sp. FL1019]|nr:mitochondrial large subunit ribosomal protein-domain-containing protein [Xylariaceae sp. FL1019]